MGVELKQSGSSGRNLEPWWVKAKYPANMDSDIQCIVHGWQRRQETLTPALRVYHENQIMAHCLVETSSFLPQLIPAK
eukprot:2674298-Pyramimonas_sp.AAC.1